jgi:hypothetical protein
MPFVSATVRGFSILRFRAAAAASGLLILEVSVLVDLAAKGPIPALAGKALCLFLRF